MNLPTFPEFFHALWDYDPFPWQTMLAGRVASGEWPEAIDLPTASGKTACLDVAVYTLAAQADMPLGERMAPRRIWFAVDRRIVVDEAFRRAERIAEKLRMAGTWEWLQSANAGGPVDFGIGALDAILPSRTDKRRALYAESEEAPVLLPAHLDALCQTSPRPDPEPDIDLFLHGKRRRSAEVQIVWRADFVPPEKGEPDEDVWIESVALLPPTSAESLTVPLHRFLAWLTKNDPGEDADVEGSLVPEGENDPSRHSLDSSPNLTTGTLPSLGRANLPSARLPGTGLVASPLPRPAAISSPPFK